MYDLTGGVFMFTFDDLKELLKNKERDDICRAVGKIPDDELRNALVLRVTQYQKSIEIERAITGGK